MIHGAQAPDERLVNFQRAAISGTCRHAVAPYSKSAVLYRVDKVHVVREANVDLAFEQVVTGHGLPPFQPLAVESIVALASVKPSCKF
jgi:hypothetical protein